MKSTPFAKEVFDQLGGKVLYAIAQAVAATKADLAEYRGIRPIWVSQHSERGLANWIHDRLWTHLVAQLDDNDDVHFSDGGPTRQFRVGIKYLFRAKRHSQYDQISTFPTPSASNFWAQGPSSLFPDTDEVRLAVGYRWDPELREIEDAVISLRDGTDRVVWVVSVAFAPGTGAVELRPVTDQLPELPFVELDALGTEEAEDDQTGAE